MKRTLLAAALSVVLPFAAFAQGTAASTDVAPAVKSSKVEKKSHTKVEKKDAASGDAVKGDAIKTEQKSETKTEKKAQPRRRSMKRNTQAVQPAPAAQPAAPVAK